MPSKRKVRRNQQKHLSDMLAIQSFSSDHVDSHSSSYEPPRDPRLRASEEKTQLDDSTAETTRKPTQRKAPASRESEASREGPLPPEDPESLEQLHKQVDRGAI